MRAPNKSGLDKVVRRIVKELGSDPDGRDTSEAYVRTTIRLLRTQDKEIAYRYGSKGPMPTHGIKRQNDDDFDALLKSIVDLQKALKKTSGPALFLLFSGEDDVHSNAIPLTEKQQKFQRRTRAFVSMLRYLRARCNYLLAEGPGEHGSANFRQRRVAHEVWRLLRVHGRKPAGGTMDSLYGLITSLVWEAVTGEEHKDLQWACKAALKLAEEGGLHDDGPIIARGQIPVS